MVRKAGGTRRKEPGKTMETMFTAATMRLKNLIIGISLQFIFDTLKKHELVNVVTVYGKK